MFVLWLTSTAKELLKVGRFRSDTNSDPPTEASPDTDMQADAVVRAALIDSEVTMPDRDGTTLSPGDPVLVRDLDDTVCATVLDELPDNRYLVQLEPLRRFRRDDLAFDIDALVDEAYAGSLGLGGPQPYAVPGSALQLVGASDDEGD